LEISVSAVTERDRVVACLGSFQAFRDFIAATKPRRITLHDLPQASRSEAEAHRLATIAATLMRRATEGLPAIPGPPRVSCGKAGWIVDAKILWVHVKHSAEAP
jgi:hypothetical protein